MEVIILHGIEKGGVEGTMTLHSDEIAMMMSGYTHDEIVELRPQCWEPNRKPDQSRRARNVAQDL